jgi:hypothetical protein
MECQSGVQGLSLGSGDGDRVGKTWSQEHHGPGVERTPDTGRISYVRNTTTSSGPGELTSPR